MIETLMSRVREYLPAERLTVIEDAYRYAEDAHKGQTRMSGEPFIEHPLQTAVALADLKMDAHGLAAALLHDVVEDRDDIAIDDIRQRFGEEITQLVDGVTKFTEAEYVASGSVTTPQTAHAQAETIRKMLMAMAEDIRVVLIKLADRLHNMRTIEYLTPAKRIEKSRETLDIYAPLAHRLGIWEMKWQLEDMAFRQLDPEGYKEISERLNSTRTSREAYIHNALGILQNRLNEAGISAEVVGRPKHIYSIHNKIAKYASQNKSVDDIHDLFALRVLVDTVPDCYGALGIIHTRWRPAPGEFDDYIANPKDNLYQSIHTTVIAEDSHPLEIQVRTREMHQLAEYGVAAHWLYKEGKAGDDSFEQKMVWLRQILEWQRDVAGAEEFVDALKSDIFQNQVFVYTPLGELKELPTGSTPLDFAFRIHSDLIFRCIGAKVNGKLVSLSYHLKNGDTCQILTSKTVRGPSLDWLNEALGYVNTRSARAKVRQWFKRQERSVNTQRGRDLYQRHIRRLTTQQDQQVASMMGIGKLEDFLAALGRGFDHGRPGRQQAELAGEGCGGRGQAPAGARPADQSEHGHPGNGSRRPADLDGAVLQPHQRRRDSRLHYPHKGRYDPPAQLSQHSERGRTRKAGARHLGRGGGQVPGQDSGEVHGPGRPAARRDLGGLWRERQHRLLRV